MKAAHPRNLLLAAAVLLCATALAQTLYLRASTVIVRSLRSDGTQKDGRKTVRVRWVAERVSKQPERVTAWAHPGYRHGDSVDVSDCCSHSEVQLGSPGFHDFTFSQLDHDNPQLVGVGADGFYAGEVFVDSGDIEVEVILRHKF